MLLTEHERSIQERIPLRCPVRVTWSGAASIVGETLNVSASGALVALPASIPLGVELRIVIELPDAHDPLEFDALAVRIEPAASEPFAMQVGLHSISAPETVLHRVRRLIYG